MAQDHLFPVLGLADVDEQDPQELLYVHSVLAQCALPYTDPGLDVRVWKRVNGAASLRIEAGAVHNGDDFVEVGLPFGPKARLVLYHLTTWAVRHRSPKVPVGKSLNDFLKRLRLDDRGRNYETVREQILRITAASIRLALVRQHGDQRVVDLAQGTLVRGFHAVADDGIPLLEPKKAQQRLPWPKFIRLSDEFFESLKKRGAIPLDEKVLAALAYSAFMMDLYSWLAQRLCRVDANRPQLVPWPALKDQFGPGYARMRAFKGAFRDRLMKVLEHYPAAKVVLTERGAMLHYSPSPVPEKSVRPLFRPRDEKAAEG